MNQIEGTCCKHKDHICNYTVWFEDILRRFVSKRHNSKCKCFCCSLFCFWLPADLHRLNPGGSESLPASADLHSRPNPPLHQQEDRRVAAAHIRHRRQLLLQHAAEQQGPVLHHQVCVIMQSRWAQSEARTTFMNNEEVTGTRKMWIEKYVKCSENCWNINALK